VESAGAGRRSLLGRSSFSVRYVRPLNWLDGCAFPADSSTLVQLVQQVFLARGSAPDSKTLVQCTYVRYQSINQSEED